MCTLIVATRVWQEMPLVVAANRDERLGRPSKPPSLVAQGGVRFYAPRDLQAGGTWIGLNAHGVFVAITNRFTGQAAARAGRSRGLLVLDALSEDSAAHAVRRVATEAPTRHDPFHMVMADASEAHLVWSDGTAVRRETLAPGFHVVTERSLGAAPTARVERLHRELPALFGPRRPPESAWMNVLRQHAHQGMEGTCVHVQSHGYGTRSSSVIELGRAGDPPVAARGSAAAARPSARRGRARWWHAEGPPCTTPYVDHTGALEPLFG